MALTHSVLTRTVFGDRRIVVTESTLDSSYPTGGEPVTAAELGLFRIESVVPQAALGGYIPAWDQTNLKLRMYQGDNANASPAPGTEVPNATNLSAIKVTLLVIGS